MTFVRGSESIDGSAAEMLLMMFLSNRVKCLEVPSSRALGKYRGHGEIGQITAHILMAFKADGRSSKIVLAWPDCENLTSADLVGATAEVMVANMRAERRCVLANSTAIMS
jgi:hypothetical protein